MGTGLHVFVKQILEPLAGIKSFFCLLHSRESCVIVEFFLSFAKVCVVSRIIKNHHT